MTINICADALYQGQLSPPTIPEDIFVELTKFAMMPVEFSFDGIIYRQTDGVSMGFPLGPILANMFEESEESLLLDFNKPEVYFRYVDDTFCLFNKKNGANLFYMSLNNIHPALKFTLDKETFFSSFS